MIAKTLKYGSQSLLLIVLMLVILGAINLLAGRDHLHRQFDLTRNQLHTISPTSLNVVRQLKDVINVTVYLSKDLPPALKAAERQLRDKLAVYAGVASGRLAIEYKDPAQDEQAAPRGMMSPLAMKGIQPVGVTIFQESQKTDVMIYMAMEIRYGADNFEVIPVLFDVGSVVARLTDDFEYQFTAKLIKVSQPKTFQIGFATNRKDLKLGEQFAATIKKLREQYAVSENVAITGDQPIQQNLDVLIVVAPVDFAEAELYQLDQFVMRGHRLIVLADQIDLNPTVPGTQPVITRSNLCDLLEHYGVTVNGDMAVDPQFNAAHFFRTQAGTGGQMINYPPWVRIPPQLMSKDSPVVNRLREGMVFPWASTLTLRDPASGGARVEALAVSSPYTWRQTGQLDLNPTMKHPENKDAFSTCVLAAAITGPLTSYYADKPVADMLSTAAAAIDLSAMLKQTQADAQIVVVGDADFAKDQFLSHNMLLYGQQFARNFPFLLNAADWMTIGADLIGIRTRGEVTPALKRELSDKQKGEPIKARARNLNMLLIPGLVVLLGIAILFVRRFNRRRLEETYNR